MTNELNVMVEELEIVVAPASNKCPFIYSGSEGTWINGSAGGAA